MNIIYNQRYNFATVHIINKERHKLGHAERLLGYVVRLLVDI